MAKFQIEIGAINDELKKILKESKIELSGFANGLNFKPKGVNDLNTSLKQTKQLLKDIGTLSSSLKSTLGGSLSKADTANALNAEKVALAQAKTEAQAYRVEVAKLAAEKARLTVEAVKNRGAVAGASGSYREAQQRLTALGKSIREAENGFKSTSPAIKKQIAEYAQLNARLTAFDKAMGNNQRNVGNYQSAFNGLKGAISGLAIQYLGLTALIGIGGRIVKVNAEISDTLADVRRTAGLTAKEANDLSESLKKIDTRTSLKGLLTIATIGGQLGIAKNQLGGFTKAVDELAVSLGSELQGGAEGIAKSLGVLDNVFGITTKNGGDVERSYNQIGSAILKLGQSGLATGDFLADFGERVGGIAKQSGLSLPTILAYGAVLQENGVSAEVAGSSFKRLLSALATNSSKFFSIAKLADANLTLKDFNNIVNTDTKRALELFFAGLKKGGSTTIDFNTILKSLKLSGAGVSQSIAALSNNQGVLNERLQQGKSAFDEATLSSEQFKLKNDNLAGSIDKLGNTFDKAVQSGNISAFFKSIVDGLTAGISKFDKFVNSSSWKEFKARLLDRDGGDTFELKTGFASNSNRTAGNQAFLYPNGVTPESQQAKLKKLGEKGNAEYLANLKKTMEEAKALTDTYREGVKKGTLRENQTTIKDYDDNYQKAKTYYNDVLKLQKKLGFNQPKPVTSTTSESSGGGGLSTKSGGKTIADVGPRIEEIIRQSNNGVSNAIADGADDGFAKLQQKYEKFYIDLANLTKKKGADINAINKAYDTLRANEITELGQLQIAEAERIANEQRRILDAAGVKTKENKAREIAEVEARYNREIEKANGNKAILATIEEAKGAELARIAEKWDAIRIANKQKLADYEQDIFGKIADIADKDFKTNERRTKKGSEQIKKELDRRLKDAEQYFDQLRLLYLNDPVAQGAINKAQDDFAKGATNAANNADNPIVDYTREIDGAIQRLGDNILGTLSTLNNGIGNTLLQLGNDLTSVFDDLFRNQLSNAFKDFVNGAKVDLKSLAPALAGGLGSIIQGATKPTSTLGQGIGGALKGAGAGFAIGGPVGAAIGGVIGAISGIFGAGKRRKEEALQKQQLEEQKKQTALMERQNALAYASSIIGRQTVNGVVTGVEVNEFGQLTTKISGQDIAVVLDRANRSRKRGT